MPSSSSGASTQELALRYHYAAVIAHLSFCADKPARRIYSDHDNILDEISDNLPLRIFRFFSNTLDLPNHFSAPEPAVLSRSITRHSTTSLRSLNSLTDSRSDSDDTAYATQQTEPTLLSRDAISIRNQLSRADASALQTLDSLAAWMNATIRTLAGAGRIIEADKAMHLAGEVLKWRDEVQAAENEARVAERRLTEGVQGLCLRWGG